MSADRRTKAELLAALEEKENLISSIVEKTRNYEEGCEEGKEHFLKYLGLVEKGKYLRVTVDFLPTVNILASLKEGNDEAVVWPVQRALDALEEVVKGRSCFVTRIEGLPEDDWHATTPSLDVEGFGS